MKKTLKWLAALVTIGTIIGIIIAYFCKNNSDDDTFDFDLDDDDFDLDSDLQPVERGYVSLNKPSASTETDEKEETPAENPDPSI